MKKFYKLLSLTLFILGYCCLNCQAYLHSKKTRVNQILFLASHEFGIASSLVYSVLSS